MQHYLRLTTCYVVASGKKQLRLETCYVLVADNIHLSFSLATCFVLESDNLLHF